VSTVLLNEYMDGHGYGWITNVAVKIVISVPEGTENERTVTVPYD